MTGRLTIFVMERGFVLVGVATQDQDDPLFLTLTRCGCVRRWGTTSGLGQLAREGPQGSTVLESEPDGTSINKRAIYRAIPCNEEAWQSWKSTASGSDSTTRRTR